MGFVISRAVRGVQVLLQPIDMQGIPTGLRVALTCPVVFTISPVELPDPTIQVIFLVGMVFLESWK